MNQTTRGASVVATAQRLLEVQGQLRKVLPTPLNESCQVLRWQEDTLTLGVPTSAHSAKLRQLLPRLAASLQSSGWQLNEIRVRVQADGGRPYVPVPPRDPRPEIHENGLESFVALRKNLSTDGPLARALDKLLQRRGRA
ncbi:DciA family protein [Verticiella sediminum]|uniref:DciA family protein n=1 Tax=Verticiella sediminum TaxID=1247510 RepID=UPI0014797EE3|nr:DciA family protein [Verticiella sediminum]